MFSQRIKPKSFLGSALHIFNLISLPRRPLPSYPGSQTYSVPHHTCVFLFASSVVSNAFSELLASQTLRSSEVLLTLSERGSLPLNSGGIYVHLIPQAHLCPMPLCQWTAWYHFFFFCISLIHHYSTGHMGAREITWCFPFHKRTERWTIRSRKFHRAVLENHQWSIGKLEQQGS